MLPPPATSAVLCARGGFLSGLADGLVLPTRVSIGLGNPGPLDRCVAHNRQLTLDEFLDAAQLVLLG